MDFFKRHRNKFLTFGVVSAVGGVGLYVFDKYVESRVAEQREIEAQKQLKQLQRQQQFDSTHNIAEKTLKNALLPALKRVISECLGTEEILKELKSDPTKTELWHQLKLLVFAKCTAQVFCGSLLQMLTRIQLHILAGYNVKENNNRLPEKIQETFLQLSQLFIYTKVKEWVPESLMDTIKSVIEPNTHELTQDISVSKLQEIFDEITKKLLAKLVLIKPTEFLLCGNDLKWDDLSKDDQKTLQALIIDTMDVIEFKDFNSVLTSCISSGYGTILDQIANDIPSGDLITQKGLKLAKLIPKLDKIFQQSLLTPNVNQSKLQSFEARIFETFCLSQPQ